MKLPAAFIENNFEVLASGKVMYKPGHTGGFSRMASPADFDGDVGSIWTLGSDGEIERDEHPFGDIQQQMDRHLNEKGYLEQQLRQKADEIADLQDAMDGEDIFASKKAVFSAL